jgi:hypothetical protein
MEPTLRSATGDPISSPTNAVISGPTRAATSAAVSAPRGNPAAFRREGSLRPYETQARVCEQLAYAFQSAPDLPADIGLDAETALAYHSWQAAVCMPLGMLVKATGLSTGQVKSALAKMVWTERVRSAPNVPFGKGYMTGYSLMPRGGLLLEWASGEGFVHEAWALAGLPAQLTLAAVWMSRYFDGVTTTAAPVVTAKSTTPPRAKMGVRREQ